MRKLEQVWRAVLSTTVGLTFAFVASKVAAHENKSGAFHLIPAASTIYRSSDQQREDASSKTIEGDWEGTIDAGVVKLRLVLHVVKKGGVLSATLDSPDQGATSLPIDAINIFISACK